MLTLTLRTLERDGMVERTVHPVVPPRVDYDLTPLGRSLLTMIEPMVAWTREHRAQIEKAREDYDAKAAEPASR
jgi:DNA-binding HxlR family transcriptional regulator